jgi:GNAT superfamily N-acetyltransferase
MIRAARDGDIAAMRAIEVAAGRLFAEVGMNFVAEDEPPSVDVLRHYLRNGRAWVFGEVPVGYLLARWVDGNVHLEQVSVDPEHAGRRIGVALVEHLAAWAGERGAPAITLTTYAEVAWNAPYYERLGFRRLADAELTGGLRRIRAEEAAHGLDRWPRVGMRRELSAPAQPLGGDLGGVPV